MTGADIARPYKHPLRIEPDFGKASEHGVESERKVACDVLKHDVPRS
jgi:hypothetical protein